MSLADRYQAFIIDLDGVLYLIREPIEGSLGTIKKLQADRKPFVFLTNNSSATIEQYLERLGNIGLEVEGEQIVTSSQALAGYIRENYETQGKTVFLIGGEGLHRELSSIGLEVVDSERGSSADFVVVGWDGDFNYRKLKAAVIAVRDNAVYLASNTDATYPTQSGLWPGAGTMVAAVSTGSGKEPFIGGKPNRLIVDYALERMGAAREDTLLIGDRLETDILAGINSDVDSLLVLTGVSTKEDVSATGIRPVYVRENLAAIYED